MYTITYESSVASRLLCLTLFILYSLGVYWFVSFYCLHPGLVTTMLCTMSVLTLLKAAGVFIMYPGAFRYYTAEVEKSENDRLLANISRDVAGLGQVCERVQGGWRGGFAMGSLLDSLRVEMSVIRANGNASNAKVRLLEQYSRVIGEMQEQMRLGSREVTFDDVISDRVDMRTLNEEEIKVVAAKSQECKRLAQELWQQVTKISAINNEPQQATGQSSGTELESSQQKVQAAKFQVAKWHMFGQKLFGMNSYFALWETVFQFKQFDIHRSKGEIIECAIIYSRINDRSTPPRPKSPRAVLMCNPNGMAVQTAGLMSQYIDFYLDMGFYVVLWNFRGYGRSTGIPSLTRSIVDAEKVYHYVQKRLKVPVQIVHGISIGGVAAINLVNKITNQEDQHTIRLLVADRTFWNVDKMAAGFLKRGGALLSILRAVSGPITRLLFSSDCVDNSVKFLECKCPKICIWDCYDKIICNESSLKYGIMQACHKFAAISTKFNKEEQVTFEGTDYFVLDPLECEQWPKSAHNFVKHALRLRSLDLPLSENLLRTLHDTDGAGTRLYIESSLQSSKSVSTDQISRNYFEYFMGLGVYGSRYCYSLSNLGDRLCSLQYQRLHNRIQLIKNMRDGLGTEKKELKVCINEIVRCLEFCMNRFVMSVYENDRSMFGDLIVSQVGHNGDLRDQLKYLQSKIVKACCQEQKVREMNI